MVKNAKTKSITKKVAKSPPKKAARKVTATKVTAKESVAKSAAKSAASKKPATRKLSTKTLFTIGYEKTPPASVFDELKRAGVKLLVDVRAVAASRRPGFSKNQLAAGLDAHGMSYVHLRGLGTPTEGRLAARAGRADDLERIYSAHLKTPQAREEMDELIAMMDKMGPVCILCYERDHRQCHRKFIAEVIEDRTGAKIDNLEPALTGPIGR